MRLHRFVCLPLLAMMLAASQPASAGFSEQGAALLGANVEGRSASLADIDNDGDLDLFFQGGGSSQRLYRNELIGGAGFGYTDITSRVPGGLGPSWSAAWADVNGDRLPDVFVGQSNLTDSGDFLVNGGDLGFGNISVNVGLNDPGFHQNVAWNDIDGDLDLDLIIGMEGPEKHEIYLQGPANSFTPVGALVGFQQSFGTKGYGMAIGDTDGDGDLDVYISTCRGDNNIRNNFYENQLAETGSLSFIDIADTNGTQNFRNSYGAEFVDMDDDGDLDLFMVGADRQPSKIFRNDGGNQFTDIDTITGRPLLTDTSRDLGGGKAVDYDNDGDLDLFFHDHFAANGIDQARKLYRNDGNWLFTDVTIAEGLHASNEGAYDSVWGDLDRDGDQDLIAPTDSGHNERVFLNNASANGNHWLYVELEGAAPNTSAVGATVYATINQGTPEEKTLRRENNTNANTFNQSDLPVHFGLGAADTVDLLRIVWPDGSVQELAGVSADQYLTVDITDILPGDYNLDGVVDLADYTVWRDTLNDPVPLYHGADGDGDGLVTPDDYLIWRQNFGASVGGEISVAPEPSAVLLLWSALAVAASMRRKRSGGAVS